MEWGSTDAEMRSRLLRFVAAAPACLAMAPWECLVISASALDATRRALRGLISPRKLHPAFLKQHAPVREAERRQGIFLAI